LLKILRKIQKTSQVKFSEVLSAYSFVVTLPGCIAF